MRRELVAVAEAARSLKLRRTPRGVAVTGTPAAFAQRLEDLLLALEALDRAGASTAEPPEARLTRGLEAVIALAAEHGLPSDLTRAAATQAMGADPWDRADLTPAPPAFTPPGLAAATAPAAHPKPDISAAPPRLKPRARIAAQAAGRAVRRVGAAARDLAIAREQLGEALSDPALPGAVADAALVEIERIAAVVPSAADVDGFTAATRADLDTDQFEPDPTDIEDHGAAIDAMADRLLHGVRRVGWSPRLRNLAIAWRRAMAEAARVEQENDAGPEVAVPSHLWADLERAMGGLIRPAAANVKENLDADAAPRTAGPRL